MPDTVEFTLPHENYLVYMASRNTFEGAHNMRKVKILLVLFNASPKRLPARTIWLSAGAEVSYSCVRSTLSRMVKFKYISRTDKGYTILTRGTRFLYAASQLAPEYDTWRREVKRLV